MDQYGLRKLNHMLVITLFILVWRRDTVRTAGPFTVELKINQTQKLTFTAGQRPQTVNPCYSLIKAPEIHNVLYVYSGSDVYLSTLM